MLKDLAVIGGSVIAADFVCGHFIFKRDDGGGFIEHGEGFGLDDVVRAIVVVGLVFAAKKVL